jgi:hypothetical protein
MHAFRFLAALPGPSCLPTQAGSLGIGCFTVAWVGSTFYHPAIPTQMLINSLALNRRSRWFLMQRER